MIKTRALIDYIKPVMLALTVLVFANASFAQYKYTRFAIDGTAGTNYGLTSVPGSFAAFSEIGLRLSVSKYLSGKLTFGVGSLRGSRTVNTAILPLDNVNNYVEYNTTYRYLNGRALINLERVFKLRERSRMYNRLNPFLVIGGGFMFPDIEVNRVDGQFKNYKKNVRFYTNCYGLDFRYFLSNRFDLTFGSELHVIQTYYLDGAYSDQKLDKFITGHIGICYNIGANSDRKHLEWFNVDGKEDIIFRPIQIDPTNPEKPISQAEEPKATEPEKPATPSVDSAIAVIDEPSNNLQPIDTAISVDDLKIDENGVVIATKQDSSKATEPAVVTSVPPTEKPAAVNETPGKSINPAITTPQTTNPIAKPATEPNTAVQPTTPAIAETTPTTKKPTTEKPIIITPPLAKYNVIAATYGGPKYAVLYCKKLRTLGFDANVIKSSKSKMFRISIYHGDDRSIAFRELNRIRKTEFNQAWIHIYNP